MEKLINKKKSQSDKADFLLRPEATLMKFDKREIELQYEQCGQTTGESLKHNNEMQCRRTKGIYPDTQ